MDTIKKWKPPSSCLSLSLSLYVFLSSMRLVSFNRTRDSPLKITLRRILLFLFIGTKTNKYFFFWQTLPVNLFLFIRPENPFIAWILLSDTDSESHWNWLSNCLPRRGRKASKLSTMSFDWDRSDILLKPSMNFQYTIFLRTIRSHFICNFSFFFCFLYWFLVCNCNYLSLSLSRLPLITQKLTLIRERTFHQGRVSFH